MGAGKSKPMKPVGVSDSSPAWRGPVVLEGLLPGGSNIRAMCCWCPLGSVSLLSVTGAGPSTQM